MLNAVRKNVMPNAILKLKEKELLTWPEVAQHAGASLSAVQSWGRYPEGAILPLKARRFLRDYEARNVNAGKGPGRPREPHWFDEKRYQALTIGKEPMDGRARDAMPLGQPWLEYRSLDDPYQPVPSESPGKWCVVHRTAEGGRAHVIPTPAGSLPPYI